MDSTREQASVPLIVPACMAALVEDRTWARDLVGEAGAAVYRLHGQASRPDLYLKHGKGRIAADVTDEMVRLRWLAAHIPVPEVRYFVSYPDEAWLLTTRLPGQTAYEVLRHEPGDRIAIVDALAGFLRQIHAVPIATCPFNADHHLRLGLARERMDEGLVDVDDFGDEHRGWSAREVWDEIMALLPLDADRVVTHGDYSLDNIFVESGKVVGCIDVGRVGIADRYQDLAILWNCLDEFGSNLQRRLLAAYGVKQPDEAKLRFHLGLDEFF